MPRYLILQGGELVEREMLKVLGHLTADTSRAAAEAAIDRFAAALTPNDLIVIEDDAVERWPLRIEMTAVIDL